MSLPDIGICPNCRTTPQGHRAYGGEGWRVECSRCDTCGPTYDDRAKCRAAWNRISEAVRVEPLLRRENDALRADNTRLQKALEAIGVVVILDNDPADTVLDIVRRTLQGRTPTTPTARPLSEAERRELEREAYEGMPWEGRP